MLWGIGIAGVLAIGDIGSIYLASQLIEPWRRILTVFAFLSEHLSVGFFVSSIAVFFYEWGAHAKDALDLSHQLGDLLDARGVRAIEDGMTELFERNEPLLGAHRRFIKELHSLDTDQNWARDADAAFLTLFVKQAADHAERLRSLREHLQLNPYDADQEFHLDFVQTSEFADKILTEQMSLLRTGDSYDTLSNPRTWSALKTGFYKACAEAVKQGAQMRRIFIMGREDDFHQKEDVRNLVDHYRLAASASIPNAKGGWYKIQIATPAVFLPFHVQAGDQHYGIFRHKRDAVAFKVVGNDVSNFVLVAAPPLGELARNFDQIWKHLEWVGPIVADDKKLAQKGLSRFIDAIFSREVGHLARDGRFEIVSTLASSKTRCDLPLLTAALKEKGIEVREFFVLSTNEQVADAPAATLAQGEAGTWIVKTCRADYAREQFPNWKFPHCRFINGAIPAHPYVFSIEGLKTSPAPPDGIGTNDEEHHGDPLGFIVADGLQNALDHARGFEHLWNSKEPT